MKITTLIKSILILLVILAPSPMTSGKPVSSTNVFKNKKLLQDMNKDKILTDEALRRIFSSIGFTKAQFMPCLEKIEVRSKKSILAIIIKLTKNVKISNKLMEKLNVFLGCPQMKDLTRRLKDVSILKRLQSVTKNFSRRLFRFLKRIK